MVKTRKTQPVLSALPASNPAVVPVISALAEEIVPDKELASEPCAPSTSGDEDSSRPVRVYADGKADGQGLNASLRVACGPDAPVLPRHIRSIPFWTRQGFRTSQETVRCHSFHSIWCEQLSIT